MNQEMSQEMSQDRNRMDGRKISILEELMVRVVNPESDFCDVGFGEEGFPYVDPVPGLRLVVEVLRENAIGTSFPVRLDRKYLAEMGLDDRRLMEEVLRSAMQKRPPVLLEFLGDRMGNENLLYRIDPVPPDQLMYILTTRDFSFGAVALFYPGVQERLARIMGGNYYAIPSSVHEFIILPESDRYGESALAQMLYEVNRDVVEPEEVLTDTLYYYDAELEVLLSCREYGECAM